MTDCGQVILPKILSADVNEAEAFQFDLVRLANEYKSYSAWKVAKFRSGNRRKKFLLEVDRKQFTKTSLETGTLSHGGGIKKPVPIKDIKSVAKADSTGKHVKIQNKWTITYTTHKKEVKTKTYEMKSTQIRDDIVNKLNFLCTVRRLQG